MKKSFWLTATAVAAVTISAQPANAQQSDAAPGGGTQPGEAQTEQTTPAQPAKPASAQAAGQAQNPQIDQKALGDIVITAQKRSESLQRAPAAVTAVDSVTLTNRGITDLAKISLVVPSAKFNIETNVVQVFIRGVGSQIDAPMMPESVAAQVNGVYLPRYATSAALFDVKQVEVLPGPQGTLYGRSAIGGVVNILTRTPTPHFEADGVAEYGNYNALHLTGVLNVPLSANVSMRGAVDYAHHSGYNDNGTDNQNAVAGRLSLLAQPVSNVTVLLWGSYGQNRNRPSPLQYVPYPPGGARHFDATDPSTAFFYPPNGYPLDTGYNHFRTWAAGGKVDWDAGGVTLSYIPGYVYYQEKALRVIVGFPQTTDIWGKQYSNELRLSDNGLGPLKFLAGLYQYHSSSRHRYVFGPNFGGDDVLTKDDSYAGYGQLTYTVLEGVRLTGGARYSWERIKTDNAQAFFPLFPDLSRGIVTYDFNRAWKRFDWKAGVEAGVAKHSLLYANVQTGFNPGTFNYALPDAGNEIKAQKMLGFTVGSKNRFFDNKVQANFELFYYRYRDQIIQTYDASKGAALIFNAPRTRMYGAQLDTAFAITPNTRLTANVSYLNAKITEFVNGAMNLAGNTLPFSPRLTVAGGFEQTVPLSSGANIKFRANSYYNSGYWDTFNNIPSLHQKRFTKTDLNLTYFSADGRYDFGLWVRNLENNTTHAAAGETGQPFPRAGAVYLEPPRTYGLRLHVNM